MNLDYLDLVGRTITQSSFTQYSFVHPDHLAEVTSKDSLYTLVSSVAPLFGPANNQHRLDWQKLKKNKKKW